MDRVLFLLCLMIYVDQLKIFFLRPIGLMLKNRQTNGSREFRKSGDFEWKEGCLELYYKQF
jgi:hypothetical protein